MSRAVSQLEHIYNSLNADFFAGELPTPIITVQSKPGTMGHCSVSKIWQRKDDKTYELNIAAEVLNYPIEETLDTMLHEMVHLYCRQHDIKEVSRGGTYHNGKFKALAEQVGLVCVRAGKYGWNTVGTGNDGLIEYTLSKDWSEIMLNRQTVGFRAGISTAGGKSPSSTRKLICPGCRQSVRATKKVNILCGDCLLPMVEV